MSIINGRRRRLKSNNFCNAQTNPNARRYGALPFAFLYDHSFDFRLYFCQYEIFSKRTFKEGKLRKFSIINSKMCRSSFNFLPKSTMRIQLSRKLELLEKLKGSSEGRILNFPIAKQHHFHSHTLSSGISRKAKTKFQIS